MEKFLLTTSFLLLIIMLCKDDKDKYEVHRNYTYGYVATIMAAALFRIFT